MQRLVNSDGRVAKYIHGDGSETCIKELGRNNKFSVFISTSKGCSLSCPFCQLTIDKVRYERLDRFQIQRNVRQALEMEYSHRPHLKNMYGKLCWMGMGDVSTLKMNDFEQVTYGLLVYLVQTCAGLDGVDVSTIGINPGLHYDLIAINDYGISKWRTRLNPAHDYTERSFVRVFHSLHAPYGFEEGRYRRLEDRGVNVHFNLMLLECWNANFPIMHATAKLLQDWENSQVRILRYNRPSNSPHEESTRFGEWIRFLRAFIPGECIKLQESPGADVNAACGMFK